MPDLKLYYSPGACSLAPHIALEETGEPYEPVLTRLSDGAQKTPEYLALNPKGRVPVIVDGGFVVTENPAVLRYIARKFPSAALWPDDPRDEARCAEWLAWCSSGVHVAYAHIRRAERYASSEAGQADVVETGRRATRAVWEDVEAKLAASHAPSQAPWAAGERYSVADPYLLVFWTWGRDGLAYDMERDFPAWTAHARRMGERPAVRRVLEREGARLP